MFQAEWALQNHKVIYIWSWYIIEIKLNIKYIHCHKWNKIVADSQHNVGKTEKSQSLFTWRSIEAYGGGFNAFEALPSPWMRQSWEWWILIITDKEEPYACSKWIKFTKVYLYQAGCGYTQNTQWRSIWLLGASD